jgi:hypothetical protein
VVKARLEPITHRLQPLEVLEQQRALVAAVVVQRKQLMAQRAALVRSQVAAAVVAVQPAQASQVALAALVQTDMRRSTHGKQLWRGRGRRYCERCAFG